MLPWRMFMFVMTLTLLLPPPVAARMHVKPLQVVLIQTNAAYQSEDKCTEAVSAMMETFQAQYPIVKIKAEVECYKSVASAA